jgi:pilus assembly protein CpaE
MARSQINALVAHDGNGVGGWVADHLPAGSGITVAGIVGRLAPTPAEVRESSADVLVVVCAEEQEAALSLVSWWATNRPARPVVVVCPGSSNGFIGRAFAAGADDLVVVQADYEISTDASRELVFALQKAVARRSTPEERGTALGSIICVLGPKGGVGKTMTCCNLGVALVEAGKRTVLVDVDLQFGDLALSLGLTPRGTIYDLATAGGSLDAGKVDSYLATHSSGLRVLMAPTRPDQAASIKVDFLRDVLGVLRDGYDFVIVDTPPGFTPEVIASIDASSHTCMVGTLDALSLKNTKLGLETLELMGYDMDHVTLILNRADSSVGVTQEDVVTILGRAPDALVPSHREIARSVNEGMPIVASRKRSEAAKAFNALAASYAAVGSSNGNGSSKRSLLTRSRV